LKKTFPHVSAWVLGTKLSGPLQNKYNTFERGHQRLYMFATLA